MDALTRQHLAVFGNQQLDTLGAELKAFALYLWELSHYGAMDTFSYFVDGRDTDGTAALFTLIRNNVIENMDDTKGYGRYRIRFQIDWRRYLEYTQSRPVQTPTLTER